jgi:peptidoglycan/LPS O-acetylase OafA/YrhL
MGYFRLALALIIMVAHLGPRENLWPDLLWWRWCVFTFYALSGYLMVLLMEGPYKGHRWRFLLSRAVRVFPTYWVVLALSVLAFWLIGGQSHFQQWMSLPMSGDWLPQVFLIINIDSMPFVPVPVAWALSVELFW